MKYCLISEKNNCRSCYKCIRNCPTKSISFSDNQATIINDECILCGHCFLVCPQNIKVIRDDLIRVKELIGSNKKVIASVAPSFVVEYGVSFEKLKEALIKLGFYDAEETAIGATIVKKAYDEMLNKNDRDIVISSCCHSVNLLMQKHYQDLLPYLADVMSPMVAHGQDIKKRYSDACVVFIGPCIAKKDESDKNNKYVDAALTFIELSKWLKEANINLKKEEKPLVVEKSKARLFPTSGGILNTMQKENKEYDYIVIDGMENVLNALKDIREGKVHKCFIEMSACSGSCINGPAINDGSRALVANYLAIHKFAGNKDFDVNKEITYETIKRSYNPILVAKAMPSEIDIQECLKKMGKTSKNKELNCGCCGYNTCRDKAIAIIEGKAVKEMCLPYLMEKAESFSDNIVRSTPNGLMVLNESLNIELINKSMLRIIGLEHSRDVIGKNVTTIMEPDDFINCLNGMDTIKGKKEYLSEYNKYIEETLVYDQKFHLIYCVIRDVTDEEIAKQQKDALVQKSVDIANKVIDKNMRSVQEIASLLGETAAETKVALSALKDTLKDDNK
jgi:PAS domain S-box-containing protein